MISIYGHLCVREILCPLFWGQLRTEREANEIYDAGMRFLRYHKQCFLMSSRLVWWSIREQREKNAVPPVTSCECFCFFCQEATGVLAFETEDAPFQTHHRKDKEVEILGFESPKVSVKG